MPASEITIGCWVDTRWGPAVCTGTDRNDDGTVFCHFRYEAESNPDGATLWVANGDTIGDGPDQVSFLRGADDVSRHVLTLTGPYGRGFRCDYDICLEEAILPLDEDHLFDMDFGKVRGHITILLEEDAKEAARQIGSMFPGAVTIDYQVCGEMGSIILDEEKYRRCSNVWDMLEE